MTRDVLLRTEELARIGSWSWEPQSNRTTWSPGMYRHYGLTPDESSSPIDIATQRFTPRTSPSPGAHAGRARDGTCSIRSSTAFASGERSATIAPKARSSGISPRIRCGWSDSFRTSPPSARSKSSGVGWSRSATGCSTFPSTCSRSRDSTGSFKQVNPAWTRTLGWTTEELLSRPWRELVHPDDAASTAAAGARLRTRRVADQLREPLPAQGRLLPLALLEQPIDPRRGADVFRDPRRDRRENRAGCPRERSLFPQLHREGSRRRPRGLPRDPGVSLRRVHGVERPHDRDDRLRHRGDQPARMVPDGVPRPADSRTRPSRA